MDNSDQEIRVAAAHRLAVIPEPRPGCDFTAIVPERLKVVSEGDTEAEALMMVEDAIGLVLEGRGLDDIPVPENSDATPSIRTVTVSLA